MNTVFVLNQTFQSCTVKMILPLKVALCLGTVGWAYLPYNTKYYSQPIQILAMDSYFTMIE